MLKYIIILILTIGIIIYILSFNRKVKYYNFGNHDSKTKICLIGGVHGNERAGPIILQELVKNKYFDSINKDVFIRVIPCVNEFGFRFNTRYQNNIIHPDINRNYLNNGLDKVSKQIIELTRDIDLVVDFHEGWGFHRFQPNSLGSTLTISKNISDLGKKIIDNIPCCT
jgi:predicted deacylase